MLRPPTPRCRRGFTLVELLTVIGIISLLISILLPSLSRARDQAKRVAVKAQLDAIGKGVEMFQNDFNQYPDSSLGRDRIVNWPAPAAGATPPNNAILTGAHWLARAMVGHDFQGVDNQAEMLKRPANNADTVNFEEFQNPKADGSAGVFSERKGGPGGTYVDPKVFARDDDPVKFPGVTPSTTPPNTGRIVVVDGYNFPVLYYRAKTRAQFPFDVGTLSPNGASTSVGVYCQMDNAPWTGDHQGNTFEAYDFGGTGAAHGLGKFSEGGAAVPGSYMGSPAALLNLDRPASGFETAGKPYKGKTFVNYFHSESTHQAGNTASAVNPQTFILISAGKDGLYGTDDDVNNFQTGL